MRHIVFDLDGTLSDTQSIHQRIEADFLREKWAVIDPEAIGIRYAGRTPQEWMAEHLNEEGITFDASELEKFVERKDSVVISELRSGAIALMPKVAETVRELARRGYVMGISSGACRQFIDEFVNRFGFSEIMRASTSANEVVRKKPHPDVFLATFEKLSGQFGKPEAKYVVGDGWSDVQGGHSALARTVWFNYLGKPVRDSSVCDFEMRSFDELLGILP